MRAIILIILTFSVTFLYGQKIQENTVMGDQAFAEGDYYSAAQYYHKALMADTTRLKTAEKYADACRLFFNYAEAEKWYEFILRNDQKQKFPDALFWLGMMQKSTGQYPAAEKSFADYAAMPPGKNEALTRQALAEAQACRWAETARKDSLKVIIRHLDRNINTPYSDFGGTQWGDSLLLFSSLRLQSDVEYESLPDGIYLTNIYQSRITPAGPAKAEILPNKLNLAGMHNANICFTADKKTFFFTRCPEERRPDLKCQLFMVKLKNGKWQKPVLLDERFNLPGYTSTQPAVATNDKEEILYFVSDRPGGMGGNDIWYSVIKKYKLGDPVNLGSIVNTPGNEITPFWDNKLRTLYFSSDQHRGFGGYDIFKTSGGYNQWAIPANIGYPLNTSYNDLYFTLNSFDSAGYLTSNRPGSYFIKSQTCCNDLYSWEFIKPAVIIPQKQKKDSLPLVDKVRELLPLTLYFHNDVPGSRPSLMSTRLNYKTTVADYYVLKDKYLAEYTKGLPEMEKDKAIAEMNQFFDDFVLKGLNRLEQLTQLLLEDLAGGAQVKLTIKGFTSPLNTAEYNKNLAKRRIASLLNFFREYHDGVFKPYLEKTAANGGKMEIFEEAIGEEQAPKMVSDNPNDARNSVYSRAAALERRIQILYYQSVDTISDVGLQNANRLNELKMPKVKPQVPANVKFKKQYHDFGNLQEGSVRVQDFEFENLGPVPFRIIALETSCGCTVAQWPKNEIAPGGKELIRVTFSAPTVKGEQKEKITIKGNLEGGEQVIVLRAMIK